MNRRDFLMTGSLGIMSACHPAQTPALPRGLAAPDQRKSLPVFSLPDMNGSVVRSGDFSGNVLILRFWATW
jgi:hypothetical protein